MLLRIDNAPREHDFTKSMWGHALHSPHFKVVYVKATHGWRKFFGFYDWRQILVAQGHGSVRVDDTILVMMKSDKVARFLVREISYYSDPEDMFELKRADFVEYVE